ncbi:LpqB family beta-propeller domain-containing protein [Phycicoccus sonneratiae]|uniref:GerMN domain-containing protein n=1 Tax=Phycicoccus sonneratiae TaxID=2807628 RepID=A0ABS2CM86_9MICO|nr:LpqB family beta-propeller domain-containing protein [Phycicoccus sonneraticus]MBM6400920.1 GerMN domain-containing protein [Phycicoccus sonneraticus]
MSRRGRLLLGVALVAVLTGCGGLSGTGQVEQGLEVGSGKGPELGVVFPGPGAGADQESIVSGFLSAGASSDAQYDNARAFLTSKVSERWNPDATIVLLADDAPVSTRLVDSATVEVRAKASATIDSGGRLTPAASGATVTATFTVSTVGGEWRIDGIPKDFGRWIAQSYVARLVQPFAVHYVSTSRRSTVPDVRWFPLDRLATRLARAQLDPVPDFLVGAGTTAVPAGTRLLGDAVSVDADGVASVNLVASRLAPGEATRQNLWAQFLTTLTQDPTVGAVSLAVDGVPVDLDGVDGPVDSLSRVGFPAASSSTSTTKPVVRRGADVGVFDPGGSARQQGRPATPSSGYPDVPAEYTHLALSADGTELAAVDPSGDGVSRWRGDTRYEVPGVGGAVGAPAYDRRGFLWVGGLGTQGQRLFVVDTRVDPADPEAARATPVRADWLAGRRVVEARVAADGDRVVVLSTKPDGTGPTLDLAGVVRGSTQRPERLAAPLRLGSGLTSARGLAWLDDRQVVTVAATRAVGARPLVVSVDGSVTALTAAPGARAVAATGGERDLYVVTDKGRLLSRSGVRWVDSGPADDLAAAAG